jgi:hypothetical protein
MMACRPKNKRALLVGSALFCQAIHACCSSVIDNLKSQSGY